MAESESLAELRFRKRDILPGRSFGNYRNHTMRSKIDLWWNRGLCMLRRLSYPCRYGDMIQRFAKQVLVFSMVTNILIDHIYAIHGWRLTQWNLDVLSPNHLEMYAATITSRGSPLDNCFGFIDHWSMAPYGQSHDQERISGLCAMDTSGSMP